MFEALRFVTEKGLGWLQLKRISYSLMLALSLGFEQQKDSYLTGIHCHDGYKAPTATPKLYSSFGVGNVE